MSSKNFKNFKIDTNDSLEQTKIIDLNISWDILKVLQPLVLKDNYQNEFSGSFQQSQEYDIVKNKNKQHIHASSCSDTETCLGHANITTGHGDSAHFYDYVKFTYHTHPKFYYDHYKVNIAPPSGEDIGVFLRGCIENKTCVHLVLSKEGIYIMIANPCFVRQARNLLNYNTKLSRGYYNIALIGAEILGMKTHECREVWSVEQWLQWVHDRFVCKNIEMGDYENEIREKFNYHCDNNNCQGFTKNNDIQTFQNIFQQIASTSFQLQQCASTNPFQNNNNWTGGNWIDVQFISWDNAKNGITIKYNEL